MVEDTEAEVIEETEVVGIETGTDEEASTDATVGEEEEEVGTIITIGTTEITAVEVGWAEDEGPSEITAPEAFTTGTAETAAVEEVGKGAEEEEEAVAEDTKEL